MAAVPYLKTWTRGMAERLGRTEAQLLGTRIEARYQDLLSAGPSAPNPQLQSQLKNLILPGLALYLSLREHGLTPQDVLSEVDRLFRASLFRNLRRGIKVLSLLPDPFPVVRPVLRRMTRNVYLAGAQEIVDDSSSCLAVKVYRCFILDTLTAHGAPELTPSFCKTDDWLAEALPQVRWSRTMTLGRGDSYCDFRWCRAPR